MNRIIVSEGGKTEALGNTVNLPLDISKENLIQAVADLEREVFTDAWSTQAVRDTLDNAQALILSTWNEENLTGYVIFYYVLDEGEIARIAVSPSFRRQGIGSCILQNLQTISEDKGIVRWLLDVRQSNETAIAFYRGLGFTEDGIRRNFYANPQEDAILMSRVVTS